MRFFIYFLFIQTAYFLWMGLLNALSNRLYNLRRFSMAITKFSVYFHELIHYFIAKLLFQPVQLSDIVIVGGNGLLKMTPRNPQGLTLIQSILIGLSPAFFSTIVIIILYRRVLSYWGLNWGMSIIYIIFAISILQVATPSFADIKNIGSVFYRRPLTSIKQISVIIVGYGFYLKFYNEIINIFSFISEPLFAEPISLIMVIIILEVLISSFILFIRFILEKIFDSGDFHPKRIEPSINGDIKHLEKIKGLNRQFIPLDKADEDLCKNLL